MSNTMQYRGYTATMSFDAEDKVIVGRVLDIDDILTFHGASVAEFEAHFHTVVDDYIAACEALGSEPERPASGRLMLRVSPEVHAASLKAAALSGTSLNRWAEQALKAATRRSTKAMPDTSKAARLRNKVTRAAQTGR
jgi:predicted HicB family RNase H-like nuclease